MKGLAMGAAEIIPGISGGTIVGLNCNEISKLTPVGESTTTSGGSVK